MVLQADLERMTMEFPLRLDSDGIVDLFKHIRNSNLGGEIRVVGKRVIEINEYNTYSDNILWKTFNFLKLGASVTFDLLGDWDTGRGWSEGNYRYNGMRFHSIPGYDFEGRDNIRLLDSVREATREYFESLDS